MLREFLDERGCTCAEEGKACVACRARKLLYAQLPMGTLASYEDDEPMPV